MFACPNGPPLLEVWSNLAPRTPRLLPFRTLASSAKTRREAEGNDAMIIDKPVVISATDASGGKKLGVMRYVLGISIGLAAVVGIALWNIYATH